MKEKGVNGFTWQIGYGAFSVSSRGVKDVERYIEFQKEHHQSKSYKSELESYIKESDVVEYDEKYFWT